MADELTRPPPHFQRYAVASLPLNCLGAEGPSTPRACCKLRFETAGTCTVKRASDNTSITINVTDKEVMEIACNEITSVTGVTFITVYW